MSAAKKGNGAPIKLVWLELVGQTARADDKALRPAVPAIHSVALVRTQHADPDGGSCFPAVETVAGEAGVARETVRAVDSWLVGHGLMVFVRRRKGNVAEYRLTLPQLGSQDFRPSPAPEVQTGSGDCRPESQVGSQVGSELGSEDCRDHQPPTGGRRKEGPTAAPGGAPEPLPARSSEEPLLAEKVLRRLVRCGHDVEVPALLDELVGLLEGLWAGWPEHVVAMICFDAVAQAKSSPTTYLRNRLEMIASGAKSVNLPAGAELLVEYSRLEQLTGRCYDMFGEDDPETDGIRLPVDAHVETALVGFSGDLHRWEVAERLERGEVVLENSADDPGWWWVDCILDLPDRDPRIRIVENVGALVAAVEVVQRATVELERMYDRRVLDEF